MHNRGKMRVTLKDIAKKSGYAVNTVSRAMRNDPKLPEATRKKIRDLASTMGYIPNLVATTLRLGTSRLVAAIVNDIQNPHFTIILGQMEAVLREAGYNMAIFCTQMDENLAKEIIHETISLSVAGILYFPYKDNPALINSMTQNRVPFVLVDRWIQDVEADSARCDDESGGYLAGRHLIALGHKKFMYLAGHQTNSSQVDRLAGFLRALSEAHICEENLQVVAWEYVVSAIAKNRMDQILLPLNYTALVAFYDEIAYYALNAFHEKGIRVPEEVSIISYDHIRKDRPYLGKLTSITTVDESVGQTAAQLLLNRINDPSIPAQIRILPVKVFDEGSTAPPRL